MIESHEPFITVTKGMAWFAVQFWWNPEGFWEPWETGIGRYADVTQAEDEAMAWAAAENIRYIPRKKPTE